MHLVWDFGKGFASFVLNLQVLLYLTLANLKVCHDAMLQSKSENLAHILGCQTGAVTAVAAVVGVEVVEIAGREVRRVLPHGGRPTPASLRSSSSWIWIGDCVAIFICRTPSWRWWTRTTAGPPVTDCRWTAAPTAPPGSK